LSEPIFTHNGSAGRGAAGDPENPVKKTQNYDRDGAIHCHAHQASPFRVSVHLVTPGPDIRVECADHTLAVAIIKVSRELRRIIDSKAHRRARRVKSNLQLPSYPRIRCRNSGR
jgi:ribosome-associated translation inhibitor RaiA